MIIRVPVKPALLDWAEKRLRGCHLSNNEACVQRALWVSTLGASVWLWTDMSPDRGAPLSTDARRVIAAQALRAFA